MGDKEQTIAGLIAVGGLIFILLLEVSSTAAYIELLLAVALVVWHALAFTDW